MSILLVYRVVCTDEEALNWKTEDIGNLRVALNALVRVFRLDRSSSQTSAAE